MRTTINKTTIKTTAMKRSILRVSLEAMPFAGFVFDATGGACVDCGPRTGAGAEVCMNVFGGTCEGLADTLLSCSEGFD